MKIKRLEILGFKSFPDKTVIEFQKGITGIVGPNGCGKSNIVDAIRWVMGEMSAKHLRGKSMEDVIFSGTERRPSTGMAEVTLVFSAEDGRIPAAYANFSEIAVRRRLYRSGESEYAINNVQCRLRDIYDLFLGTGVGVKAYSIIEQGRIGQVISSKPEERRLILEEAAGISKFKSRKEAALRKIDATRGNLLRLSDLIGELKRQINSLDRQAKKAEKFKVIQKELKEIELHLGSHDFLQSSKDLFALEEAVKKNEESEAVLSAKVSESENRIENSRLTLVEKERDLMQIQEALYEKNNSVQLHQASVDHKTREIETLTEQSEAAAQEITLVKDRLSRLEDTIKERNENQVGIDLELASSQEKYGEVETRLEESLAVEKQISEEIEQVSENIYALIKEVSDKAGRKESLERRKVDLAGRLGRDQAEIDEIDSLIKSHQGKVSQVTQNLGEGRQLKLDLGQQTQNIEATIAKQKDQLQVLERELNGLKDKLALKKSRWESLRDLEKSFEGYKEGVRNVLVKKGNWGGQKSIFGTVADIVDAESTYQPALSAALGEKVQYVVVQNQEAGVEALQYLKSESSGRLSCIPLSVSGQTEEGDFPYGKDFGVLGPLQEFVRLNKEYQQVGGYLFSDTYLVESLTHAIKIWNHNGHRKTLVTLDGEVVDSSGVVSGGSKKANSGGILEKKQEIQELQGEVSLLESQVRKKIDEVEECRSRISHLEKSLEVLRKDSHGEELKLVHQEQDVHHIQNEIRRLTERRDKLSLEISNSNEEELDLVQEIKDLESEVHNLEDKKLAEQTGQEQTKSSLSNLKVKLEEIRKELMEAKSSLALVEEKKSTLDQDLDRFVEDRNEAQNNLESKRRSITNANAKIITLKNEIEESRETVTRLVQEIQEQEQRCETFKAEVGRLQNGVQEDDAKIRQDRKDLEEIRQGLNQKILNLSEGRTKVQVLREQILERYHLDLSEIAPQYQDKEIDRVTQGPRAIELRQKLEKIGSVNLGAIEEYEELQERYEFLNGQYQDLESSLDGLVRAIQKVNRTTKKRLQEAFTRVNELFQEVFPKLFKGGHAELRLTDPENILESGVDIVAQPPGKKLQNVTLLSGGEKALTAISLVFSIFLLKPSPFCLLDEVDAPLDDVNIERFNEMVRSMVDHSQFIIITHNKRTMEMANVLYGITMEQAGVSKMVSVKLDS